MSKFDRARRRARAARSKLPLWARNMIALEGFDFREVDIGRYAITHQLVDGKVRGLCTFYWDVTAGALKQYFVEAREARARIIEYELNEKHALELANASVLRATQGPNYRAANSAKKPAKTP